MSIRRGDKGVILKCHAGCELTSILHAIELRAADLFDTKLEDANGHRPDIVATYDYVDENDALLFQVVRFNPKDFRQRRRDKSGGWSWKLEDTRRVLYHLPQIIQAIKEGRTIYVVEGEKDVHALEAAGEVATCNPGGAGKWKAAYTDTLAGAAHVVVVRDRDPAGIKHAADVEAALIAAGVSVAIREPAAGKDISDHLNAGKTVGELTDPDVLIIERPFTRIAINLVARPEPTPQLVRGIYGAGLLTVLQSEPGAGKTWLAGNVTVTLISDGHDVVYIDEEGGSELVTERLIALGANQADVDEHLWYYAFENRDWGLNDLAALEAMLTAVPRPALGVLDSLPDFLTAANLDEDKARDVTSFIAKVCGQFRRRGCAQLLLDHLPKPSAEGRQKRSRYSRGSGAKLAKADATLLLQTVEEFDAITSGRVRLWKTKDRRGRLELPSIDKPGLDLTVTVCDGSVSFDEWTGADLGTAWDGPTHCMADCLAVLNERPNEWIGKNRMGDILRALNKSYGDKTVRIALERLANDHAVDERQGPRRAHEFRAKGNNVALDDTF